MGLHTYYPLTIPLWDLKQKPTDISNADSYRKPGDDKWVSFLATKFVAFTQK